MNPDLSRLKSVCQQLQSYEPSIHQIDTSKPLAPPALADSANDDDTIEIKYIDVANLANFVRVWTDVYSIESITGEYQKLTATGVEGEPLTLERFEEINNLVNVGFFYVQVNPKCAIMEFLGLIDKFPFEQFCLPGTTQMSYAILSELFKGYYAAPQYDAKSSLPPVEMLTIQLMVLGDFYKFWILINPYTKLKRVPSDTKLILSAIGSLAVQLSPRYIKDCLRLVQSFESVSRQQVDTQLNLQP